MDKVMKYKVYVLTDEKGMVYKGMTSNLEKRLSRHVRGHTITTARMRSLRVAHVEEFDTFEEARRRELYLKSAAGRRFLKNKMGP